MLPPLQFLIDVIELSNLCKKKLFANEDEEALRFFGTRQIHKHFLRHFNFVYN